MSHVVLYLGKDGRSSKMPFINLFTMGNWHNGILLLPMDNMEDKALRAVLM